MSGRPRLGSLDAVRGIAACAVVVSHCELLIPEQPRAVLDHVWWLIPLRPFYNGNAAVVVFFILSGYVLSLPYLRGTQLPYPRYVVRRLCRIYIPFLASLGLALALYAATPPYPVAGASDWINSLWPRQWPDVSVLLGHVLMFGTQPDIALNPLMWTLVHELRISLLLPLLMLLCRDTRLAACAVLLLIAGTKQVLQSFGENTHPSYAGSIAATWLWTAQIAAYFITGILLSKHRAAISALLDRLPGALWAGLFVVPFAIFCMTQAFASVMTNTLYAIGAAVLVVLAIESHGLRRLLERRVPQWLGRVSYSLYLVHLPLLLAAVPLLTGLVPLWAEAVVIMALSLVGAVVMHALVEAPAIRLGHWVTGRAKQERGSAPDPARG